MFLVYLVGNSSADTPLCVIHESYSSHLQKFTTSMISSFFVSRDYCKRGTNLLNVPHSVDFLLWMEMFSRVFDFSLVTCDTTQRQILILHTLLWDFREQICVTDSVMWFFFFIVIVSYTPSYISCEYQWWQLEGTTMTQPSTSLLSPFRINTFQTVGNIQSCLEPTEEKTSSVCALRFTEPSVRKSFF